MIGFKAAAVCRRLALGLFAVANVSAFAQAEAEEPIANDLQEQVQHIPVKVKDMYGREETRQIPITLFRPAGEGPFPLVIMNHGRSPADKRAHEARQRFEPLSRYLVSKGFAVLVPTRVGYGETFGDFDPEESGQCSSRRLEPMAIAASDEILATLEFAKTMPFINASRWLVMGQSVGGFATVATVSRNPPGLVGAINFAGGVGGNPEKSPGQPCSPIDISRLWKNSAKTATVPMLWLYWENDLYWGASYPKQWHEAWVSGGAKAEFHTLAAAGANGHDAMKFDMDHWVPFAEVFLAQLGFGKPGLIVRPAPTSFAKVGEVDKLPASERVRENAYRKFLDAKLPRAMALGADGAAGWATGDWAMGRALGFCQRRRGQPCKLYAVDDDVVWAP